MFILTFHNIDCLSPTFIVSSLESQVLEEGYYGT